MKAWFGFIQIKPDWFSTDFHWAVLKTFFFIDSDWRRIARNHSRICLRTISRLFKSIREKFSIPLDVSIRDIESEYLWMLIGWKLIGDLYVEWFWKKLSIRFNPRLPVRIEVEMTLDWVRLKAWFGFIQIKPEWFSTDSQWAVLKTFFLDWFRLA